MSTADRCPTRPETDTWNVAQNFDSTFCWEYDDGRDNLLSLYEKGKKLQWNAADRIDWSQELDEHNPGGLPDEVLGIYGTDIWDRLDEAGRTNVRRHFQAWQISQFLHGEQGALVCTAKIVQQVPNMDAKFYASTQVVDEARHVAFGRLALRDYYPHLTDKERDEREEFVVEGPYLLRDRFLGEEVGETLGLPVRECKAATERSEFMSQYRSALFSRIVPTIKDIGLWGPRVRKAYADMGVLGFADTNVEELGRNDEEVALQFDERHRNVEEVAAVGREAIRYYIREGLLPEPERPARNVAWYDESFVEKIRFIKELQEKRYLPLNVIGRLLASDGDSSRAEVEALLDLDGKLFPQVEGSPKLEGERLVVVARRSRALGGNLEGWVQSGRGLPVRTDRSVRRHGGVART